MIAVPETFARIEDAYGTVATISFPPHLVATTATGTTILVIAQTETSTLRLDVRRGDRWFDHDHDHASELELELRRLRADIKFKPTRSVLPVMPWFPPKLPPARLPPPLRRIMRVQERGG